MSELLKFFCDFGSGASCTITLDLVQYRRDPKSLSPKTEWTGDRTEEMFPTYLSWIHTVNGIISKAIQSDHTYVIQTWFEPPHWQFWLYHPDGTKTLVQEGDGQFDRSWIGR